MARQKLFANTSYHPGFVLEKVNSIVGAAFCRPYNVRRRAVVPTTNHAVLFSDGRGLQKRAADCRPYNVRRRAVVPTTSHAVLFSDGRGLQNGRQNAAPTTFGNEQSPCPTIVLFCYCTKKRLPCGSPLIINLN